MFTGELKEVRRGIKHCEEMQRGIERRVVEKFMEEGHVYPEDRAKVAAMYAESNQEALLYWEKREALHREALKVFKELEARYRKHLGRFAWFHRNGHGVKVGLRLMAHARLSKLEEQTGVEENGGRFFGDYSG